MRFVAPILLAMLAGAAAFADDRRAQVNYMLHCQGCHLPEAKGFAGKVPPMKDFVGYFVHSQNGREFLIRVPGVAQSALDNAEIAELMNWLLTTHSAAQLPDNFTPYTEAEVAELRANIESDPDNRRVAILHELAAEIPALAADLDQDSH